MRNAYVRPAIEAFSALIFGLYLLPASSATLTEDMDIECRQPDELHLICDYRLLRGGILRSAVAEVESNVITGEIVDPYPQANDTTAILVLIDTSDPARQAVVKENGQRIAKLMSASHSYDRVGLGRFDADLTVLCPIGSTTTEMLACADSLDAVGRTTELYRNVLGAIDLISAEPASRRLIVLMSDGLAEDFAYHHSDVVSAARERRVTITSIGYPRSVAQSVALQTLRKLSEDTGGLYVQADHTDLSIPSSFFDSMFDAMDSGGAIHFDLQVLASAGLGGPVDVSLGFQTEDQSFLVLVAIRLPAVSATDAHSSVAERPVPAPGPVSGTPAAQRSPPVVTPPIAPENGSFTWFWFGVPAALLLLILIGLVVYALMIRKRESGMSARTTANEPVPYAFLVMRDDDSKRYMISQTPWRIGRGKNNDLTLDDHSVSRLHAEIRRNQQGHFALHDLESLNGVFVNEKRASVAELKEGDNIDIGDVGLNFTLHDEDYASQDPTVLIRTRTPV